MTRRLPGEKDELLELLRRTIEQFKVDGVGLLRANDEKSERSRETFKFIEINNNSVQIRPTPSDKPISTSATDRSLHLAHMYRSILINDWNVVEPTAGGWINSWKNGIIQ